MNLKILTPKKTVLEQTITSLTVPGADGELTILPQHTHLFAQLQEGILTARAKDGDYELAIGGGYVKVDSDGAIVLVSRAFGQHDIDEKEIETAVKRAEELAKNAKTDDERQNALELFRRSTIDLQMLKRLKLRRR